MQISFVMLTFLLFSDQISGGKSPKRGNCLRGAPPCGRKPACIRKIQTECELRRKDSNRDLYSVGFTRTPVEESQHVSEANRDLYSVGFLSSSAEVPHLVAVLTRSLTSARFPMSGGTVTEHNSAQSFCFSNKVTS